MKSPTISHRLSSLINDIEKILGVTRTQFTRSDGHSFYSGWHSFSSKPVKSSARYLYHFNKNEGFSFSFGFYFLDDENWKLGRKMPIEDQRMTISYGFVTKNDEEHNSCFSNRSDHYTKDITTSEQFDINEAKHILRQFRDELLLAKPSTLKNKENIVHIFEKVLFNIDEEKQDAIKQEFLSKVEGDFSFIQEEKNNYYEACKKSKSSKKNWKNAVSESDEQKQVLKLRKELDDAQKKLQTVRLQLKREHNVDQLESAMHKAKRTWDDIAKEFKQKGNDILKSIGAPFRLNKIVEEQIEIDKNKI